MGHEVQDRASLEMARIIAAGLPEHLEWLELAKANIARWSHRNRDAPSLLRCYDEWRELLDLPVSEICAILTDDSDRGRRLRQNSPFPGVLSPREVWAIKARCRDEAPTA